MQYVNSVFLINYVICIFLILIKIKLNMEALKKKYEWKDINEMKEVFKKIVEEYKESKDPNISDVINFIIEASIYLWATDFDIVPLWRVWKHKAWISIRLKLSWKNTEFYFIEDKKVWWELSWSLLWAMINKITSLAKISKDWKNAFDWRYTYALEEEQQDYRISWLPTIFWYEVTFRAFENEVWRLNELQLSPMHERIIKEKLAWKSWLILVSWPTGSWKTTLAYACLAEYDPFTTKIVTVEDPVEKILYWVIHVPIDETAPDPDRRFTFDKAGRTLMRQTAEVIFFGEMRDWPTIKKAVELSETWHLVISTTHASDVQTVPSRLQTAWADLKKVIAVSELYVSQRLLTRLCETCKIKQEWLSKKIKWILQDEYIHLWKTISKLRQDKKLNVFRKKEWGCKKCKWMWEIWRISVVEVFDIDSRFSELVTEWSSKVVLEDYLLELRKKWKFYSLKDDAVLKYLEWNFSEKELLSIL